MRATYTWDTCQISILISYLFKYAFKKYRHIFVFISWLDTYNHNSGNKNDYDIENIAQAWHKNCIWPISNDSSISQFWWVCLCVCARISSIERRDTYFARIWFWLCSIWPYTTRFNWIYLSSASKRISTRKKTELKLNDTVDTSKKKSSMSCNENIREKRSIEGVSHPESMLNSFSRMIRKIFHFIAMNTIKFDSRAKQSKKRSEQEIEFDSCILKISFILWPPLQQLHSIISSNCNSITLSDN